MRFSDLDCVTLDARGTLIELVDPTSRLDLALRARGLVRSREEIGVAFRAEVAYYLPRATDGRDQSSLEALRRDCAGVFLDALAAPLEAEEFAGDFGAAIAFLPCPGVLRSLCELRARGIAIAVVSNWDVSLPVVLASLGLSDLLDLVVTSAEAGVGKPDPGIFAFALERLGVAPERALHIGDEESDRSAAGDAGMLFAPAPLVDVLAGMA
jgi:HAD superfamily hydrolase (TIGR01509 family)